MEWSRVAIRKEPPIRTATRATEARHDGIESDLAGTAAVGGPDPPCSTRASSLRPGRQALDAVLLSGTHGAESVMRIELEEIAGPDQYSSDPALQQWSTLCRVAHGRRPDGQAL